MRFKRQNRYKKMEGQIEFAIQISGELFPDKEALEKMARVIKENEAWTLFLEKLRQSEIANKEDVLSFFEKL